MAERDRRNETNITGENRLRGVRGAVQIAHDTEEAILAGAEELLRALAAANGIREEDVASVFFSTTADLTAVYPAQAARRLGWWQVALFGMQEQSIQGGAAARDPRADSLANREGPSGYYSTCTWVTRSPCGRTW